MRKRGKPRAVDTRGKADAPEAFTIERGIDAIDELRDKMRDAGMIDCADALDEVFIRCLRDYVTRGDPPAEPFKKLSPPDDSAD